MVRLPESCRTCRLSVVERANRHRARIGRCWLSTPWRPRRRFPWTDRGACLYSERPRPRAPPSQIGRRVRDLSVRTTVYASNPRPALGRVAADRQLSRNGGTAARCHETRQGVRRHACASRPASNCAMIRPAIASSSVGSNASSCARSTAAILVAGLAIATTRASAMR